ncbi:ATP-dependent Lon protease [Sporosarcina sp. P2]|uniref:ATP-dependent Lon protease n=1 Tax=Sporosarcina sp. P2 TaxID=2048251 RepID=UPI000C172EE5|nr:ATP-dependent Lon protease [Sporosarcina sp. P2]PID01570.1 ATP-dependent Lon protease [Sporosarcina sp. P2]
MKLVGCILMAGVLGILAFTGPIGWYMLATIIVGVIFRSFWLLKEIHQHTVPVDAYDGVKAAYERYIFEREEREKSEQDG